MPYKPTMPPYITGKCLVEIQTADGGYARFFGAPEGGRDYVIEIGLPDGRKSCATKTAAEMVEISRQPGCSGMAAMACLLGMSEPIKIVHVEG